MTTTAEKKVNQLYAQLMGRDRLHVRVGAGRQDGTDITLVGNVWDLHGPDGCTCRHGRSAS